MSNVLINITVHARGEMATKLLEAADELGLPQSVIKTTSEGFRVPTEVHQHLFPSVYENTEGDRELSDPADDFSEDDEDQYDAMDFPELRETAKSRELSAGGSADEIRARLREADQS
jgi:hypothetical protein